MSLMFVCKYRKNDGWSCRDELTDIGEPGIFESDIGMWLKAFMSLENDRQSYERVKDGDKKAFREELLRHYHNEQESMLELWKEDEAFLKIL